MTFVPSLLRVLHFVGCGSAAGICGEFSPIKTDGPQFKWDPDHIVSGSGLANRPRRRAVQAKPQQRRAPPPPAPAPPPPLRRTRWNQVLRVHHIINTKNVARELPLSSSDMVTFEIDAPLSVKPKSSHLPTNSASRSAPGWSHRKTAPAHWPRGRLQPVKYRPMR